MVKQLDAAVIGCGRMGAFTSPLVLAHAPKFWFPLAHAQAITSHSALRLAAVCDMREETVARAAAVYRAARTYTDPLKLLDEVRPELISVATRTVGRADIVEAAIGAGVRALHVEKPLCNSMRELASLEALISSDSLYFSYGALRRLLHSYKSARNFIATGALGNLLEVQVNTGRSRLFWTHPHSVDMLLFATSGARVESVSARLADVEMGTNNREVISDPWVESATFQFEGGIEGRITRAPGSDVVFSCERGALSVEADAGDIWIYEARNGEGYHHRYPWVAPDSSWQPGGTLAAISQLVDCLNGDPVAINANRCVKNDVLRGQRLLFAMIQSHARGGSPIVPDDVEDEWTVWARVGSLYA